MKPLVDTAAFKNQEYAREAEKQARECTRQCMIGAGMGARDHAKSAIHFLQCVVDAIELDYEIEKIKGGAS